MAWFLLLLQVLQYCCSLPGYTFVANVLWSDPVREDVYSTQDERANEVRGVHRSPRDGLRGRIVQFGTDVTKRFCERNALRMIIRSHQWEREGFRFMHGGRLLTVFSARDYDQSRCDDGLARNHGARARARARVRACARARARGCVGAAHHTQRPCDNGCCDHPLYAALY